MAERVSKITISLPADLLDDIDGLATESGESRSFVVREAATQYLARKRDSDAAAARRRGVDRALEIMREISSMPVLDDTPSLEILHELRDDDDPLNPAQASTKETRGQDE